MKKKFTSLDLSKNDLNSTDNNSLFDSNNDDDEVSLT